MVGGVAVDRIRLYFSVAAADIEGFPDAPLLVLLKSPPSTFFLVQILERQNYSNEKAKKALDFINHIFQKYKWILTIM